MTANKKNITLINLSPPYGMDAGTLILAASHRTSSVHQLLVCEKEILLKDLTPSKDAVEVDDDEEDDDEDDLVEENSKIQNKSQEDQPSENEKQAESDAKSKEEITAKPIDLKSLATFFEKSHTVVLPDSMFYDKSRVFHTEIFIENGALEALKQFYISGGTVIVMCIEGFLFAIDEKLNKLFGTDWKIQFSEVGSCSVVPTDCAVSICGPFLPKNPLLKDNPHFIHCKEDQGLYKPLLQNKEQFVKSFHAQDEVFERLGIEQDESLDCFNVEKSWEKYRERYTDCYAIAVHERNSSSDTTEVKPKGTIVWYGDRGQSETMAFVFCKLLNLDPSGQFESPPVVTSKFTRTSNAVTTATRSSHRRGLVHVLERYWEALNLKGSGGSTVMLSIVVLLIAIAVQFHGIVIS